MSFIHTTLLKWLREKLGRSGLRILCEVRRFRFHVYLMLLRRFSMKVSRDKKRKEKNRNSVRKTCRMKNAGVCFVADHAVKKSEKAI